MPGSSWPALTTKSPGCRSRRAVSLAEGGDDIAQAREQKVSFRRGDRVCELDYYGEGECSVWLKGVTGVAECGVTGLTCGAELRRYAGPDKPVSEVWAYVETANRQRGWIGNPKAKGISRND